MTSILALHAGEFVQVIEGVEPIVEATFARIRRDGRHRDIVVLRREAAFGRSTTDGMLLVGHSTRGRRALERMAGASGSSLAATDVTAMLTTLLDVVAWETRDVQEAAADDRDDAGGACGDSVRPGLDVVRLRTELATAGVFPAAELAWRAEDGAADAVLAMACFSAEGVTCVGR